MSKYAVIGIHKRKGVRLVKASDGFENTKEYETIRNTIFDIQLPSEEKSPALAVMPVSDEAIVISEITYIPRSEIESRPHTCQHVVVKDRETFEKEFKDSLDDSRMDSLFLHSMEEIDEFSEEELKCENPEEMQREMSDFFLSLTEEEQCNFYENLKEIVEQDKKIALSVADSLNRRNVMADMYRLLPEQYAAKFSCLTEGRCLLTEFNLVFISNEKKERIPHYETVTMEQFLKRKNVEEAMEESMCGWEMFDLDETDINEEKDVLEEMFLEYLTSGGSYYQLSELRYRLFEEYEVFGVYEVRARLRQVLLEQRVPKEREEAFIHLTLLTFEMTSEEFEEYRKNNPYFICCSPYYLKEFEEFLKNYSRNKRKVTRLFQCYRKIFNS